MNTTQLIKNDFNKLAQELGCKARLYGSKKCPKFRMWIGTVSTDGYEIDIPISADRFAQLIADYPQLHYFTNEIVMEKIA